MNIQKKLMALLCLFSQAVWLSACTAPSSNGKIKEAEISAPVLQTTCLADSAWVTNPSLPTTIPGGGSNFCEFYQFSWQTFLYLVAPSSGNAAIRNFEDANQFPVMQTSGNSCSASSDAPRLFIRTSKDDNPNQTFTLPERIGQAGGEDTIYDQNGNVVFYSVMFSRDLCTAPHSGNLPANTTELKLAWRVIDDSEKDDYIWIDADIILNDNSDDNVTLGLVGFHSVRGTADHPELVWASYEHKYNAPNCINPASPPVSGWSFLSQTCQDCLVNPSASCQSTCNFNGAVPASSLTGQPSEICRIFPEGSAPGDLKASENIAAVTQLNDALVGPSGILTSLPASNPMAIAANYFNIGSIWVSDISQPSANSACPDGAACNQRGALQLANPVMETTFQGSLTLSSSNQFEASTQNGANCFACHQYTPGQTASESHGISHIFHNIPQAQSSNDE